MIGIYAFYYMSLNDWFNDKNLKTFIYLLVTPLLRGFSFLTRTKRIGEEGDEFRPNVVEFVA